MKSKHGIKHILFAIGSIMAVFSSACNGARTPTLSDSVVMALPTDSTTIPHQSIVTVTTSTSSSLMSLPDLVVSSINVGMVDGNGRCLNGYNIQAVIFNQGLEPAEEVVVAEVSTGQQLNIGTLEAGKKVNIQIPAAAAQDGYLIIVDPQNLIAEIDETNNNLSYLLPTPTPFAGCEAMPTDAATSTPAPFSQSSTPLSATSTVVPHEVYFPAFLIPSDWLTYSSTNPPFEFRYPPDAHLSVKPDGSNRVLISVPYESGTQMIGKSVEFLASTAPAGCADSATWQGVVQINGVEYKYMEGWDHNTNGQSLFHNRYATSRKGYCYSVFLNMALQAYGMPHLSLTRIVLTRIRRSCSRYFRHCVCRKRILRSFREYFLLQNTAVLKDRCVLSKEPGAQRCGGRLL